MAYHDSYDMATEDRLHRLHGIPLTMSSLWGIDISLVLINIYKSRSTSLPIPQTDPIMQRRTEETRSATALLGLEIVTTHKKMGDYKTINDLHLTGPCAYRTAMEELRTAFQELSGSHVHELESDVGKTLGVIANLYKSAPIPDEPSVWVRYHCLPYSHPVIQLPDLT